MSPEANQLDPDAECMRQWLRTAERRVVGYLEHIDSEPCHGPEAPEVARELFRAPLPDASEPLESVLDQLFSGTTRSGLNTASGRHLGFVPGGGLFASALAEFIAASLNRYSSSDAASPGAAQLEATSIRWLVQLLRLPPSFFGVLTSGGSLSTLMALQVARCAVPCLELECATIYASELVHPSFDRAVRLLGLASSQLRKIPVDDRFCIDCSLLAAALETDRARGMTPLLVCGNAGTVSTGAIDPLAELARLCRREGVWFHVDGAYGGAFSMLPELDASFDGLAAADSIVVDPHKGMFLPYGTGALLLRDPRHLRRAFALFPSAEEPALDVGAEPGVDFFDLSPELTRPWRGLGLWLPLKLHGPEAFRAALRERRQMSRELWDELSLEPGLQLSARPELSAFAFRLTAPGATGEQEDALNRRLVEWVQQSGRVYITGTQLGGRYFARICVLHLRTQRSHLSEALELLRLGLRGARDCMQASLSAGQAGSAASHAI